jgi:hypothetical protein
VWYDMEDDDLNDFSWIGSIPPPLSTDWRLVATVDLNNDGSTDILASNISTGENAVIFMDGPTMKDIIALPTFADLGEPKPLDYEIIATGDFNYDGRKDILWHNKKTQHNQLWFMDGTKLWRRQWLSHCDKNWRIVGTGHFNYDLYTDILWQDSTTGRIAIWYLKGSKFDGDIAEIGYVTPNWEVQATADMNGDGKPDILLRDPDDGRNVVWYMDNNIVTSREQLLPVIQGFNIVGTGNFRKSIL